MPQRTLTPGLLWFAAAALLALLLLLLGLRTGSVAALDAAIAINVALLPLPLLCVWVLRRGGGQASAAADEARSRARLLAQLSHQIRTPMNAMMGMTQLALQTPLSAEQRDLLTRADAASRTLLRLVNDLLEGSRIEAGELTIETLPLRLEDVVAQAVEVVRARHDNPGVALICDWADASLLGARGQLRGDAQRLQQVLLTLLSNALRFTTAGQVVLRLSADPSDAQARVPLVLSVQDSGVGMGAEQLAQLLRETQPADTGRLLRHDSHALGLLVAHRIVAMMGGSLDVQSTPGQGSRFELRVSLPLDGSGLAPAALPPQRVLLAMPEGAGASATLALLKHLGLGAGLTASTDVAATLAALSQARESGQAFDWLLLDWLLPGPGPTGAELLARLRRDHPALRIAVLSPPGVDEAAPHARAFGARALCPLPLLPQELRRLFNDATSERVLAQDPSLAGLRVLLVEDHPVNQEVALRLLSSRGAQVEVTSNGQQGLDLLRARGPAAFDLVLMDLEMPVLDGLSATRQLRALPGFESLPVLAMTAHTLAEERAQCLAAGMQGHITKPLDVARLVRELQHYRPAPTPEAAPAVLDTAAGLLHFDGQIPLYRRTLEGFAQQYADGLGAWAPWLAMGNWSELRRAAHTLQGLAATLGAQHLHRAALALERSAAVADAAAARDRLGQTEAALTAVLGAIHSVLSQAGDAGVAPPAPGPGDLDELRRLLSQSDSRALDWWQAHGAHSGLDAAIAARLEQALAALDFEAAALALQEAA